MVKRILIIGLTVAISFCVAIGFYAAKAEASWLKAEALRKDPARQAAEGALGDCVAEWAFSSKSEALANQDYNECRLHHYLPLKAEALRLETEALRVEAPLLGLKAAKEAASKAADKFIDHVFPGGDNRVAHDIKDDVFDGKLGRAAVRALGEPSEISKKQGEPGAIPYPQTQHVTDMPVVPASPANENATPVHQGRSEGSPADVSRGFVDKSALPPTPRDVGVTPVPQQHNHDSHPDHSPADHPDHWAGPDHPSHTARDTA